MHPVARVRVERVETCPGMHTRVPQHLVHRQVANAGEHLLIQPRGLDHAFASVERRVERIAVDVERIRSQRARDRITLTAVPGQPHAAELAHLVEPQLAVSADEDHPVVVIARRTHTVPRQGAAHREVQHHDRSVAIVGGGEQPLAVASAH